MAAYAALVSLMNDMEQIQNHPRLLNSLDKKQIESLGKKVGFFLDFMESYNSHGGSKEAEDLESQIASAAHAAEDVIESHIVDQILAGSTEKSPRFLHDLHKIIVDMDSIKEKVVKVKEEKGFKDQQSTYFVPAASSRPLTTGKTTMVGFDDELTQLMDVLTREQSSRQIIPIVGMGGIGKTTLARNLYENSVIVKHFDICAWATISQEYNEREILLELLSCQGESGFFDDLGEQLHKNLSGRRYLIILDDMWSIEVWDKIKFFFPDNGNRSRVVITTRLSNVAIHCGFSCFRMNFLDEDKSWNLFCEKVFGHQDCPRELEEIGKEIAKLCKGLPLAIVVIGGFLRKSHKTIGYWQNVAENINSILNSGESEQCLNVLSLSYSHLPAHLKPCFLYMGIFQEDNEIRVSQIIKLWVAEGFLKPNGAQILEEIAYGYVMDLIDRNLILVSRYRRNGKIKSCRIHDLLRDLCIRMAEKENFFCDMSTLGIPQDREGERRFVFHGIISRHSNNGVFPVLPSASLARTLICESVELWFRFRLLRVLNMAYNCSPETIFQNVNLRFLSYHPWNVTMFALPSSISLIWNLQTLVIRRTSTLIVAPVEIWKMPTLRHVEFDLIYLLNPPQSDQQDDSFVLGNLQTLLDVVNFRWTEEVCKRISNIKKLHIRYDNMLEGYYDGLDYCLFNLGRLHKIESLNIKFFFELPYSVYFPKKNLMFPSSLNKLSLTNCRLHWEELTTIGSLPQLEVLKLERNSVVGREWSPIKGEFLRLKFLKIVGSDGDLISWTADSSHFPVLEKLILVRLEHLNDIPWGIGEIPTLELIRLEWCSESANISAMKIKEEQESLGNDGLQIQVKIPSDSSKKFRERVEIEGLTISNIQLEVMSQWQTFEFYIRYVAPSHYKKYGNRQHTEDNSFMPKLLSLGY